MTKKHIPVLLQEVLAGIQPKPGRVYIDATLGFGGHSEAILKKAGEGSKLYGIDQDDEARKAASKRLQPFGEQFTVLAGNFRQIDELYTGGPLTGGILADIGVSSYQLDEPERGFSFREEGPLDMRMSKETTLTAGEIVNEFDESEIERIIKVYGEETFAKRIAKQIVKSRQEKHIETTKELAEIVSSAIPRRFWTRHINPATKTFQALRIFVNDELGALEEFLPKSVELLAPGARLAVISFHSLEDRIVKDFFATRANPCTCPPEFPKCVCGKMADVRIITRKPIVATEAEILKNPRSRSAKLRIIEKI